MKKTVCLITDWYPTKANPYQGLFFKEQAFLVKDEFDFLVVRYREHIYRRIDNRYKVSTDNIEQNTKEYIVDVNVPLTVYICDLIYNYYIIHIKKATIAEIGKYTSKRRKEYTRNTIVEIFTKCISEHIDVLYCVDAQREAYYLQCLSEYYDIPYVVGEHAPVPWPGTVIRDINRYAIEKADLFLAISNDKIRQMLIQNIKLPKTKYIGNMVDETKLAINNKETSHKKTFIIIAANSFYKNYDMFIDVMNRLIDITSIPFRVIIVGYAANIGYSKDRAGFERKIKESKFSYCSELIPEVNHERIGEVIGKADAFVMTSIQEGQPVSAMEAACCGLPIFSTACGGVEDYVDEKTGRIFNLTDVEGMSNALGDYLEGRLVFDSRYIRERIVERFGSNAFKNIFCNSMNEVIENH